MTGSGPAPASGRPLDAPIVHVVTSLELGGAQRMLEKLVSAPLATPERTHVVSLLPAGAVAGPIRRAGATVHSLELGQGRVAPMAVVTLGRLLRRLRPALVQGWMYHGNLAASLATLCTGLRAPVLWNVRGALDDPAAEPALTRWVVRAGAALSAHPRAIVYNAAAAAGQHAAAGYRSDRHVVIGNGFDLDALAPDPLAGPALRQRLGVDQETALIGIAAEVRPMKDHGTLLAAMARLDTARPVRLVMLGNQADPDNEALVGRIDALGLASKVHLLGPLADPRPVIKGLDLAVLSSAWGEGFPNAIGEAMAAEVPCVATDTGDCAALIGDTGRVVPRRDSGALATALAELLALTAEQRRAMGRSARRRMEEHFSLAAITRAYRSLYARWLGSDSVTITVPGEARAA